jgi:hypothetical protein
MPGGFQLLVHEFTPTGGDEPQPLCFIGSTTAPFASYPPSVCGSDVSGQFYFMPQGGQGVLVWENALFDNGHGGQLATFCVQGNVLDVYRYGGEPGGDCEVVDVLWMPIIT